MQYAKNRNMMKPTAQSRSIAQFKEKNPLLARDDVGKPKPSTHDLPGNTHVFGVKNKTETHGAGRLTSDWHISDKSSPKKMPQDYQRLNRMGVQNKVVQAHQVKPFREKIDVRVPRKVGQHRNMSFNSVLDNPVGGSPPMLPVNSYGKANRPQTPVKGIINAEYAERAEGYFQK